MKYKNLDDLELEILNLNSFKKSYFYVSHLEKGIQLFWKLGSAKSDTLKQLYLDVNEILLKNNIKTVDIISHIGQVASYDIISNFCLMDYLKVSHRKAKELIDTMEFDEYNLDDMSDIMFTLFAHYIMDTNKCSTLNINECLELEEYINNNPKKYFLTKMSDIKFQQTHYIFNDRAYLYNYFIKKSSCGAPDVFKIIYDNFSFKSSDFFLRTNSNLEILEDNHKLSNQEFEYFRGITFDFEKTNVSKAKEILVHLDPITNTKLLMVIKKKIQKNIEFWDIEIEELPYCKGNDIYITTKFIHGQFYPKEKIFKHIDYTINQYTNEKYKNKYNDNSITQIKIDSYTDTLNEHYKVWCLENVTISEKIWAKIVAASLDNASLQLFYEMVIID